MTEVLGKIEYMDLIQGKAKALRLAKQTGDQTHITQAIQDLHEAIEDATSFGVRHYDRQVAYHRGYSPEFHEGGYDKNHYDVDP